MSYEQLIKYSESVNIASELSDEELSIIGNKVLVGFREDLNSMQEWLSDVKKVEELAALVSRKKNTPLPNSANVKLPIITKACYEFSSATYPEIIKDDKVVKTRVIGKDLDGKKAAQGQRTANFMNYQLLQEHQEWELDLDNLLNQLPLIGFICKKTYYDPIRKMIKSDICDYKELIVHSDVKSLDDASRISHILHLRLNDFIEAKNTQDGDVSVYLPSVVDELVTEHETDELDKCIDVIEQHCKLDLDKDGYSEPYIVTVTKEQGKVLRIVARYAKDTICKEKDKICYITPIRVFVDYHFLKSPKGKFQSIGFGLLLLHLNESCNSVLNQLLDSGQLANMKGGYKDARLKIIETGNSLHDPGEFKDVKVMTGGSMKDGIVPIQYGEPSSVLHQLLGLLMETCRDLTSSAEVNNGTQNSQNAKTGATLALQQAGRKMVNAINKRIYRSLNNEFRQLFDLNALYLDPIEYRDILDDSLAVRSSDFDTKNVSIVPVADPGLSSEAQRMAEAQFIEAMMAKPGVDPIKAVKAILERSMIPGIKDILADENAPQQPNPDLLKIQGELEHKAQQLNIEGAKLHLEEKDQLIRAHQAEAEIALKEAQSLLAIAQAQALPITTQLKDHQLQLDAINSKIEAQLGLVKMEQDQNHQKQMQETQHSHEQDLQAQQTEAQPNETQGSGGVSQ